MSSITKNYFFLIIFLSCSIIFEPIQAQYNDKILKMTSVGILTGLCAAATYNGIMECRAYDEYKCLINDHMKKIMDYQKRIEHFSNLASKPLISDKENPKTVEFADNTQYDPELDERYILHQGDKKQTYNTKYISTNSDKHIFIKNTYTQENSLNSYEVFFSDPSRVDTSWNKRQPFKKILKFIITDPIAKRKDIYTKNIIFVDVNNTSDDLYFNEETYNLKDLSSIKEDTNFIVKQHALHTQKRFYSNKIIFYLKRLSQIDASSNNFKKELDKLLHSNEYKIQLNKDKITRHQEAALQKIYNATISYSGSIVSFALIGLLIAHSPF